VLSSLNFSIGTPGAHTTSGVFQNTTTNNNTVGPVWSNLSPAGFSDPTGHQSQWILVDQNLTGLSWTLQGVVRMEAPTTRNENLRLNITGYSLAANFPAPPQEVPEPAAYAMMGAGLAVFAAVSRLRRKA
jgi:hypothetical protein